MSGAIPVFTKAEAEIGLPPVFRASPVVIVNDWANLVSTLTELMADKQALVQRQVSGSCIVLVQRLCLS